MPFAFQWSTALRASSLSTRPTISSSVRKPSSRHDLAQLLRDEAHEVDDVLGLALELLAQPRVLRRHAGRAGVEVADAHHDAARRDERRGREAELLGAEQRGDRDVAAGLQLAVGLDRDAAAQVVEHQRLVRLGEAELPGQAGVRDRGLRRGARAAVVAADQHDVGVRLGDARGDRADADFGDQLDADARAAVGVLQVVDQLGEVLDRVDVVVRRRRDQPDARRRVPRLRDRRVDLGAGQLAALAGLRALRHLDLQFRRVDEVFARHAEAARGDLLDRASSSSRPARWSSGSAPGPRRLRRCCSCRRCGSSRSRASRALPC